MALNCLFAVWLKRFAGFLALTGVLALSACGGGSGAPNNPFAPPPPSASALVVLPTPTTAYSGVPTTLTVQGGVGPYRAFSSNATVLPVAQTVNGDTIVLLASDVGGDTPVVVTVQDAIGQTAPVSVTVRAATLLNTFSVTPNRTECGANAICSGQTGVAAITVLGPGGAPVAGRQVRFDVVSGPYSLVSTNPGQPNAASMTVVSDASGSAQVVVSANVDAPTQPAQIRATDLTSGQQRTAQFLVIQNTNGQSILSVVPGTATITGVFKNECSIGARVDYYIYGGTPPYRVTPSFPQAVTVLNSPVNASGGFFEALTNGTCVDPLTFSILDATGRQTTATLQNLPGTDDRPGPAPIPALILAPGSVTLTAASGTCSGTVSFIVVGGGGTRFAVVSPTTGTASAINQQTGQFNVTIPAVPTGSTFTVTAGDAVGSTPATATITCN